MSDNYLGSIIGNNWILPGLTVTFFYQHPTKSVPDPFGDKHMTCSSVANVIPKHQVLQLVPKVTTGRLLEKRYKMLNKLNLKCTHFKWLYLRFIKLF